jgi:hypothetical protein
MRGMIRFNMRHSGAGAPTLLVGALALQVAACGGKEHPPSIGDDNQHLLDADVVAMLPMVEAGAADGGVRVDGGAGSTDPLAPAVKMRCTEKPPYGVFLCFAQEKGHPAETAGAWQYDARNGGIYQFRIDADHRVFDSTADNRGFAAGLTVAAPMGKQLVPGSYSTETGAELSFYWDRAGKCPGAESGTFEVYAMTWDDTQPQNVPTKAEIDFHHHCGDLTTPALSGRYRLNSSRLP